MTNEDFEYVVLSEQLRYWEQKNECVELELEILAIKKDTAQELSEFAFQQSKQAISNR